MMPGSASGLRNSDWKIAPLTPSAAPNTSAAATRGSRHSTTMSWTSPVSPPVSAETTCPGLSGYEPVISASTAMPATATASTAQTTTERHSSRTAIRRRRSTSTRRPKSTRLGAERASVDARAHSPLAFFRRTSAMRTGAPTKAVTMPTGISPGRITIRPRMSETSSRLGASRML